MTYAQQVGLRIVKAREHIGLNQAELAQKTGINVSVLNRIEQGIRPTRDNELLAISNATKVSTDYLLGRDTSNENIEPSNKISTIAAHIDDDVSDEQMEDIIRYINMIKLENEAKGKKKKGKSTN